MPSRRVPRQPKGWVIPPSLLYDMYIPDSHEELEAIRIHPMSPEAARARLVDICNNVRVMINDLIPTFIPILGQTPHMPGLGGRERKSVVDECFSRIDLPVGEWLALEKILPPHGVAALRTLARAIDELWRRWEQEAQEVRNRARDAGVRSRDLALPERAIKPEELTCIQLAVSLVTAALTEAVGTPTGDGDTTDEESGPIPPEHRTRPLSISEAAHYMGFSGRPPAPRKRLARLIKDRSILFEKINRQTYIFHMEHFPEESWDKVRAT